MSTPHRTTADPGLPDPGANSGRRRFARQYTLPASISAQPSWKGGGLPESHLTFVIAEPSTDDEEEARRFAKGDPIKMGDRLQDRCTIKIGEVDVRMNHVFLKAWKEAIGLKGRKLVEAKFLELFHVAAEDEAEMEATGKDVFV